MFIISIITMNPLDPGDSQDATGAEFRLLYYDMLYHILCIIYYDILK